MQLKVFSCHHVSPRFICNTEIFQTFVSNVSEPSDGSFISDLSGDNIAADNLYAELRQQYFIWKNQAYYYDYVGFEHYRRPFFIDVMPAEDLAMSFPEVFTLRRYFAAYHVAGLRRGSADFGQYFAMRRSLDAAAIQKVKMWISSYDIVVPKSNDENIEQQWKSAHDADHWNVLLDAVASNSMFNYKNNYIIPQLERCYFANMYIMKMDLFKEYMSFCFEALAFCRSRLSLGGRALGYFSERLFSFWIYQKRIELPHLRVLELPFVFHDPSLDLVSGDAGS